MGFVSNIRDDLIRYIESCQIDGSILAVYLFGSYARGESANTSDIDLAFLLNENTYQSDPIHGMYPAHLFATQIGLKFNKETDVTILNSSSLELAYEVITSGKCLYELDPNMRMEYELKIKGMFFDFKPFLEDLRSKRLARI